MKEMCPKKNGNESLPESNRRLPSPQILLGLQGMNINRGRKILLRLRIKVKQPSQGSGKGKKPGCGSAERTIANLVLFQGS